MYGKEYVIDQTFRTQLRSVFTLILASDLQIRFIEEISRIKQFFKYLQVIPDLIEICENGQSANCFYISGIKLLIAQKSDFS